MKILFAITIFTISCFAFQSAYCEDNPVKKKETPNMHEELANATLRIVCGDSVGSGFHFRKKEIIITNHHVIEPHFSQEVPITATTEQGEKFELKLLSHSPKNEFDYAILRSTTPINSQRTVLIPKVIPQLSRGSEILFSGFPHGIPDLLVHKAIVSAPINDVAFYIDGSINGGNSGGPIIDATDKTVIGIVTQRRFLGGPELDEIANKAKQLRAHCQQIAGRGRVVIMGINFGQFAALMSESTLLIEQVLKANANSGIGIGFRIEYVNRAFEQLGIK